MDSQSYLTLRQMQRISDTYAILAPRKLTAVHFVSGGSDDRGIHLR